ncbi:hypothetical protein GGTG_01665 [Gaeumannomyces tritici R3-111a-1]|uniref:WW domain-containing protein n=1 Tax=Gaeumannomyces tritici (strain R3-111a-1) TaxID=644352 RepID=J3NK84_GAET3|nr:hypothetical protein GGTG_01665 [Gaeumannomyces tritici R3-111a-1]EJT81688.1 hypothetical protein GGTG_01665 [Gaeumannomyces tritici R3-111a-1]
MASPADSTPAPLAEAARDSDAAPAKAHAAASPNPASQLTQTTAGPAASIASDAVASPGPGGYTTEDDAKEEGEADEDDTADTNGKPTITSTTSQPAETQPPLPAEPTPEQQPQTQQGDGWDYMWHAGSNRYYFFNSLTGESTWDNPRVPPSASTVTVDVATGPQSPAPPPLPTVAGGYNPAIHGDYDTWYAEHGPKDEDDDETSVAAGMADPAQLLAGVTFNRVTGQPQRSDQGADWHGDEGRARRQMNSFFDVDSAANAHDGRSLKAERAGKRLTRSEVKHYKEKRKAKKDEKRRAWLRD